MKSITVFQAVDEPNKKSSNKLMNKYKPAIMEN